jgi:3-(3-hydroxy-phenyl)propionate hydroxylase
MTKIFETALYPYQRSPDQDAHICVRRPVIIIGAGPVGLALTIDLAQQGLPVVLLDDNDRVSTGSRAFCFAKRPLEILDRLGCGQGIVDKGVTWHTGKVFFDTHEAYSFSMPADTGQKRPAFVNIQQYYLEEQLVQRLRALQQAGYPVELRGRNKVSALAEHDGFVRLEVDTPEGPYNLEADWLVACDGANSVTRQMLGRDFVGHVYEDNFLIADVVMQADFPSERWFWFDPPFNRGQSALLHKQPDNVWRIDLQLGRDIDADAERKPENVRRRLHAMLGEAAEFELEWVSVYTFQCRRMEKFRYGRTLFAGDAAHQVSPFASRGANSGLQDADNLAWKLKLVVNGDAPETLLDSYNDERRCAADEDILHSNRASDFITPKSEIGGIFRDAVLDLAVNNEFARPMVNAGRQSAPCTYDGSQLNGHDDGALPPDTRPGAPAIDAPTRDGWLLDRLGNRFQLLVIGAALPKGLTGAARDLDVLLLDPSESPELSARYLGDAAGAIYLLRPDQHVAARWTTCTAAEITAALTQATGARP